MLSIYISFDRLSLLVGCEKIQLMVMFVRLRTPVLVSDRVRFNPNSATYDV